MPGSAAEREIRDAVAGHIRRMGGVAGVQGARVVHELVMGERRVDLAAVGRDRLVVFEIKSERDTLSRLAGQVAAFQQAAHQVVVVAHRKWFEEYEYGLRPTEDLAGVMNGPRRPELWCHPAPTIEEFGANLNYAWRMPRPEMAQPRAWDLLSLLWRAELVDEATRNRVAHGRRAPIREIVGQMAWHMTGREIAEAVCRQLRRRPFPEADTPDGAHVSAPRAVQTQEQMEMIR